MSLSTAMSDFVETHQERRAAGASSLDVRECLETLLASLGRERRELARLRASLREKQGLLLSEDTQDSRLHRTVCGLVELAAQEDHGGEVADLAAQCLGELGPVDFNSTVLRPNEHILTEGEIMIP